MRVLVTGAGGLIGREVVRCLAQDGHEITALSRSGSQIAGAKAVLSVDLLDRSSMKAAMATSMWDALIHLAWHSGQNRMAASENFEWAGATLDLVSEFAKNGGRRVIGAGSCAEYDWRAPGPFREDEDLDPQSLYGVSKLRTGQLLCDAASALGLTVAWARIFFVFGNDEPRGRLLGDLIHGFLAGERVKCSDGLQIRDFLHAADVALALRHLLDNEANGAFNVASGTGVLVRDFVLQVARAFDAEHLVDLGALKRPENDPPSIVADMSKLEAKTGFAPEFDMAERISRAARTAMMRQSS